MTSIEMYEKKVLELFHMYANGDIDIREFLTTIHNFYYEVEKVYKQEQEKLVDEALTNYEIGWADRKKQFSLYEHKDTITSADTQVSKTFLESVPQQETLYTEEQVRKAYFKGAADVHDKCTDRTWRGIETKVDIELLKKLNAEYIQSLKQPKQ